MAVWKEERRRYPRISLRVPVRYQIRGRPESDNAISDNICSGGLSFTNSKFIAPTTLLMLEFNVLSRILRSVGRVAWASGIAHSDKSQIGVEFLELDNQEKNYLNDFLNMHLGLL